MKIFYFFIVLFFAEFAQSQIITTITGDGQQGYTGNGGPAVNAENRGPVGVVEDNSGNIYFADVLNNVIRKINRAGIISVWAGTGTAGYSGDGGLASNAELENPSYLNIDNKGNFYFVDQLGKRVRKINTSGIITTIAGNGSPGYTGDGGPATSASFSTIYGDVPDSVGNIYICDGGANVIRKIDKNGIVTTIAGTGVSGYSGDGGPATSAQLNFPLEIGIDATGNIYIPDWQNFRIRKINNAGIIATIAGTGVPGYSGDGGPATAAQISGTWQVTFDDVGNMYFPEGNNNVIRKIDCSGIISTVAGNHILGYSGDGGPAISAELNNPINVYCDHTGNLFISEDLNNVVRKVTLLPSINSAPSNDSVCSGTNAKFNVNINNADSYQWQINNGSGWLNISADSANYKGINLDTLNITNAQAYMNGYQFRCIISSSCNLLLSYTDTLFVTNVLVPSLTINASQDTMCSGQTVIFTSTPSYPSGQFSYQWQINGNSTGVDNPTFTSNTLNNGDKVSCLLVPKLACAVANQFTSNTITVDVLSNVNASISILPSSNNICFGVPVTFTAYPTNAGNAPTYQWMVNGVGAGNNDANFTSSSLQDGDKIYCILKSSLKCAAPDSSQLISMVVNASPLVSFNPDTVYKTNNIGVQLTPIISGNIVRYQWSPSTYLNNPTIMTPIANPVNATLYDLMVTSDKGCIALGKITVFPSLPLEIPNAFTPNGDGHNDVFRIPVDVQFSLEELDIFDRWGNRVFASRDKNKGWDGTYSGNPANNGTYVYMIKGETASGKPILVKGTVNLIR